jgi:Zn-dependent protease with chaperone function
MIMRIVSSRKFSQLLLAHAAALLLVLPPLTGLAQTKVKPGFNIFSPQQDIEIGRESAAEAEKQLPVIREARSSEYINRLGQTLAQHAPGERYPYTFKIINASDINAFALPGGPIYINRGTIEAARNEGELAGVMAHEIAHVALRHGTNQASKAYLAQAGLGILGGVLGGGTTSSIIGAIGGFGLNTVFLKYSRDAETQADVLGAQMLARAGYNPIDMANFFETLQRESGRDPSKLENFFSSHPAPANRLRRIEQESELLRAPQRSREIGGFSETQSSLARMPKAPTLAKLAKGESAGGGTAGTRDRAPVNVRVEPPSSSLRAHRQRDGIYEIAYPQNWRAYPSNDGIGVTFAPEGGAVNLNNQAQIVYGAIVNLYNPFDEPDRSRRNLRGNQSRVRASLSEATEDLVSSIRQSNPYLRVVRGSEQSGRIDARNAMAVTLLGRSPVTGRDERVQVYTRALDDEHIFYVLFISPNDEYRDYSRTFDRMLRSLDINDRALHR